MNKNFTIFIIFLIISFNANSQSLVLTDTITKNQIFDYSDYELKETSKSKPIGFLHFWKDNRVLVFLDRKFDFMGDLNNKITHEYRTIINFNSSDRKRPSRIKIEIEDDTFILTETVCCSDDPIINVWYLKCKKI